MDINFPDWSEGMDPVFGVEDESANLEAFFEEDRVHGLFDDDDDDHEL